MKYVKLGKTGIEVSKITLGMMSYGNPAMQKWYLDLEEARPLIKKAIDLGINFFDTANVYSRGRSEEITGEVLKEYRDEVVIATKVFFNMAGYDKQGLNKQGLSRYNVKKAISESLKRLQMDYVDLYQIHRLDDTLPPDEILRNLNQLIDDGKTLHIGASSMYAWQFAKLQYSADKNGLEGFKTMQNHYNLVYREEEREMFPLCKDLGVATITWSPLARGFLSGKYKRNEIPSGNRVESDNLIKSRFFKQEDFDVVDRVLELSSEKGVKPTQIALAWLFTKDYVTSPIIGATKQEHLEQAVESLSIKLSDNDIKRLEEPYKPHEIIGHN
jgi:aryl-alcohol dehydrogenase (NADP+)